MIVLTDLDLDALRRALAWGVGYQARNPQLRIFPDPMPPEGSAPWLTLAEYLVYHAQSHFLGMRPWESPPVMVEATNCAGSGNASSAPPATWP
jgi:hypothetical protein